MKLAFITAAITILLPLSVSADCVVPMDARGSSAGRTNSDEAALCIFGDSGNDSAPQPLYVGTNNNNYYGLSANEERAILRGLNRRYKSSASSGLIQQSVVGATTPYRKTTGLSVNPR